MWSMLKLIAPLGAGWLQGRQKRQEQNHKLEAAKVESRIKRVERNEDHDNDMDEYFVKSHGFIQRISFFVFLTPAIMAFTGYEEEVGRGFDALEEMPLWYQYTLGGMMIAIWGYRKSLNKVIQTKLRVFTDKNGNGNGNGHK